MEVNIKKFLSRKGVKQYEAAEILGITPETFSNKITGKSCFTLNEARKLAKRYDMSANEIKVVFF